jgi:hypothetical protein
MIIFIKIDRKRDFPYPPPFSCEEKAKGRPKEEKHVPSFARGKWGPFSQRKRRFFLGVVRPSFLVLRKKGFL